MPKGIFETSYSTHQQPSSSPQPASSLTAQHTIAAMSMSELIGAYGDSDLFNDIPKLEGKDNWEVWKYGFYAALNAIHPIYSKVVFTKQQAPTPPAYLSTDPRSVIRAAIKDQLGVGQSFEEYGHSITVTKIQLKEKEVQTKATNTRLKDDYERKMDKWRIVNQQAWTFLQLCITSGPRALIRGVIEPRAAYLILEERFAPPTWQSAFGSFNKLSDLRYDGIDPREYVHSFQEALQYMTESTGKVPPGLELCLFMKSINDHSSYEPVFWGQGSTDLQSVYAEFIRVETTY